MPKSLGTYNNQQIVQKLQLIANLLEIKGEIIYKTLAYCKQLTRLQNSDAMWRISGMNMVSRARYRS